MVCASLESCHCCSVLECSKNWRAITPYLQDAADAAEVVRWVVIILKTLSCWFEITAMGTMLKTAEKQ